MQSIIDDDIQLTIITQQINRYVSIFLFLFDIIGNLFNYLVFI